MTFLIDTCNCEYYTWPDFRKYKGCIYIARYWTVAVPGTDGSWDLVTCCEEEEDCNVDVTGNCVPMGNWPRAITDGADLRVNFNCDCPVTQVSIGGNQCQRITDYSYTCIGRCGKVIDAKCDCPPPPTCYLSLFNCDDCLPLGNFPMVVQEDEVYTIRFDAKCPITSFSLDGASVLGRSERDLTIRIENCDAKLTVDCECPPPPKCYLNLNNCDDCLPLGSFPREVVVGQEYDVSFGSECPLRSYSRNGLIVLGMTSTSVRVKIVECQSTLTVDCECGP